MPDKSPILHLLCGKIAAGKTTQAAQSQPTRRSPLAVTEARFHQFSSHFAAPTQAEGFTVVLQDDAP